MSLTTIQTTKQQTRHYLAVAADKMKIATASTMRGENKGLDIAVVKATTSAFHVAPKEKHVRTLKMAVYPGGQHRGTTYIITELISRLHQSTDWLTALKTLMVLHRLMRETDISFMQELLRTSETLTAGRQEHVLNMQNFIDTSNIEGRFEFSEWVRAYGKYLDEQLEVFSKIQFYQEQEQSGEASRMRTLSGKDLLIQLPYLQRLLQRLVDCRPGGPCLHDEVVQESLAIVAKESFKVYKAISEGLINLADRFFEMEYLDAQKGLEIYKEAMVANERLQAYYRSLEQIDGLRHSVQFPKLESPPADFLEQMENYVREAPRHVSENGVPQNKKRMPPLRKGSRLPAVKRDFSSRPSDDPGMVVPVQRAPEPAAPPEPEPTEADLLNFGDLSVDNGNAPAQAAPSAHANGGMQGNDFLSQMAPAPVTPPEPADPFGHASQYGTQQGGGFQTPPANGFGGSGFGAGGYPQAGASPYSTSSASSAYPSPPITPPQQSFQTLPSNSSQAGAQTPTTPPTASTPNFGPANITTPYGGSGPALLAKKDASLHDPFADLTGLKPSNAPKVAPALKTQTPMGGGGAGNAPATIAAFQGFSPSSSGFSSPAQQNSFTGGQPSYGAPQSMATGGGFSGMQQQQQQGGFPVYMGNAQSGFGQGGFGPSQQQMGGFGAPSFVTGHQQPPRPQQQPQAATGFPASFTPSGNSLI
ncbi:hypothetical protein WJX74_008216 [Apatococcus lobatus]|uniref:ENTH domain-containing protein n=1 Tax=Apatococcus lobatus TaxID=904363 RepID=A0AAW1S6M4_9CHLO